MEPPRPIQREMKGEEGRGAGLVLSIVQIHPFPMLIIDNEWPSDRLPDCGVDCVTAQRVSLCVCVCVLINELD